MAKGETYDQFVDKFKPKLTTDDCYTPAAVYDAVAGWVAKEYKLDQSDFVRPFWPGGDYESYDYPDGCVVVDNPPFSILSKIVRFYDSRKIRFFLWAPSLTLFGLRSAGDFAFLPVSVSVTYATCRRTLEKVSMAVDLFCQTQPLSILLKRGTRLRCFRFIV